MLCMLVALSLRLARAPLFNMPRTRTPLAELGSVGAHNGEYCAQVRFRDEGGLLKIVRGPDRRDRRRAETDLAQMRAAGAVGTTRDQGLQYMAAEARRLQVSAGFEAEVRAAVQRPRAAEEEEETAVYPSDEEPEDDPWLLEYSSAEDPPATPPLPGVPGWQSWAFRLKGPNVT